MTESSFKEADGDGFWDWERHFRFELEFESEVDLISFTTGAESQSAGLVCKLL